MDTLNRKRLVGQVSFRRGEPGYEDCETIENGLLVAAKSGFTGVALQPNTNPIIDNQSQVHFVQSKAKDAATQLYPIGALTKESLGKDMAEVFAMKNAGSIVAKTTSIPATSHLLHFSLYTR